MGTVRIARDLGDVSALLPEGCDSLIDAPHPLVHLISSALTFLSWYENRPKKECPPRRIWLDGKALDQWWKDIEKDRERESDPDGPGEVQNPVKNEAAALLLVE